MAKDEPNLLDRDGNVIECATYKPYSSNCLICKATIIIHCNQCSIQVTGCGCTVRNQRKAQLDAPPPH